ncbi:hypothetical protein [Ornithinimicrobium kibberense]|uniref:hypothetical protein n=1 Tax=Ornithinimicrobium kibberense TaxID=282060 RepID=UPI003615AB70
MGPAADGLPRCRCASGGESGRGDHRGRRSSAAGRAPGLSYARRASLRPTTGGARRLRSPRTVGVRASRPEPASTDGRRRRQTRRSSRGTCRDTDDRRSGSLRRGTSPAATRQGRRPAAGGS